MKDINLYSDCQPEEQIAGLRHFLMAGELGEPFDDAFDDDEASFTFIQV